ncbi:MAG: efflux RND transporter permease subunit [Planctomycetota bacterium]
MSLPRASVTRPVFTTMVASMVLVLGLFSVSRLRIDLLPEVELPTLTVSTSYEGASPEVMERLVTQIIEEILATVPGIEEMSSSSSEGNSSVSVTFAWGTDIDIAATEVRAKLEDELNELPDDISRPTINAFDVNSFPVVILGISSKVDPVELTSLVEEQVRYRFARLPGVAQVDLWGGYDREVRVELDAERIRSLNIPLNDILTAIRDANLDLPAGEIESGRYEVTLRAPAEFRSLDEIEETVVSLRDGVAVTLGQIATINDTYERLSRNVRVNGELGLRVAIRKQADANTVEVSNAILGEIERVNRDFSQIQIVPVSNQGNFIERSIQNVGNTVLYGGGLAILVLLAFLRSVRSTAVIAVAIPMSVIATFAMVYFGGFTLNLMTLGGLALGVGMMVDSSIVVLENIYRKRREDGLPSVEAAVSGAREVGGAILASTLTTLVIFLPIVFVRGVSGVLFRELAYVIAFSLVCSLLVSLTLVPMLGSKLLVRDSGSPSLISRAVGSVLNAFDDAYRDLLGWVVRNRVVTILGVVAVLGGSLFLLPQLGREFLPPSDEGEIRVTGEMEIGTRLEIADRQTRQMEHRVLELVPELDSWVSSVGSSRWNPGGGATGSIRLSLVPAADRERSNAEIANELRSQLSGAVAGMSIRARASQGQFVMQRLLGGDTAIVVEVRGFDRDILSMLASRVSEAMEGIEGLVDIDADSFVGTPQQEIRIDRAKAAIVGVSVRDISEAIETAIAGSQAGEYRTGGNAYRILVRLDESHRLTIQEVLDLTVRSESGEAVALRNLVGTETGRGPIVIRRKDQQRLARVTADVAGRDLGSVAKDLDVALAGIAKPIGYSFVQAGTVAEQRTADREMLVALSLALVLVFMVLACQYESFRSPLIVMLSVPFAGIGVIVLLFVTDTTLNIQSYIGCIMLGGIVVNNAILLVDQIGRLRSEMGTTAAIMEAGRRRLRPILMTTLTTILGLTPLALGIGEGADAQAPLARAVIGGLVSSMLTTLVLIPALYSLSHRERMENQDQQSAVSENAVIASS